ncbi:hypothetical protein [Salinibaculum rarum]|uniref:hypothetical protein n=1 Tax=Salinibaculum rarum TaxID=3058903 RepID=UPI00265FFCD9|nr:hypothetical protein [Salinibaculum sp. KK48]
MTSLRSTPLHDHSDIGMEWTTDWRYQVADFFCGRGGVGRALLEKPLPIEQFAFIGFDIEDYSDSYPGRFKQVDLFNVSPSELADRVQGGFRSYESFKADVIWASFPCTAYSSLSPTHYGSQEAALEANPRITDEFREFLLEMAPHYVIENVPRATKIGDLKANVRVNGLAFGLPFNLERHFETTFKCPSAYLDTDPDVVIDTRDNQSVEALADAKGVPSEWGKQSVRSAMPTEYVTWILHHCPSVPGLMPQRKDQLLVHDPPTDTGIHSHPHLNDDTDPGNGGVWR